MKQRRLNPSIVFILGFCTFGIADLIFVYLFSKMLRFDKDGCVIYPMKEFILNIITFGIYGIYWTYMVNRILDRYEEQGRGRLSSVLLAIAAAFPVRFIALAITYSRIEKASEHISYIN
jgi:hypothetical protein